MKKKARFYLGFFICSGERVKTVFTCSRVFLSLICTNARTRINTGFFVHSLISISQAVRGRTGQVTNAALGRRGLLRAANWKARAQVGWRQVKFSLKPFSKGLQGVGRSLPVANALRRPNRQVRPAPQDLQGGAGPLRPGGTLPSGRPSRQARPVGPAFPYFPKRGDGRPPLGVAQSPGVLLVEGAGRVAQRPLPGLSPVGRVRPVRCIFPPAAPVKAVELCSTPRKLLKKFDQNFSLSLPYPSAAPYTMRNKGWLNSTTWPLPTQISATVPSTSAGISFISFMASMMHRVSPFFTWSPTSTKGRASGLGAE